MFSKTLENRKSNHRNSKHKRKSSRRHTRSRQRSLKKKWVIRNQQQRKEQRHPLASHDEDHYIIVQRQNLRKASQMRREIRRRCFRYKDGILSGDDKTLANEMVSVESMNKKISANVGTIDLSGGSPQCNMEKIWSEKYRAVTPTMSTVSKEETLQDHYLVLQAWNVCAIRIPIEEVQPMIRENWTVEQSLHTLRKYAQPGEGLTLVTKENIDRPLTEYVFADGNILYYRIAKVSQSKAYALNSKFCRAYLNQPANHHIIYILCRAETNPMEKHSFYYYLEVGINSKLHLEAKTAEDAAAIIQFPKYCYGDDCTLPIDFKFSSPFEFS